MSFQSENIQPPMTATADLKAKLVQSAKKLQENTKPVFNVPVQKEENRKFLGAMTPRTQAQVETSMEQNVRRAIEAQKRVVNELCQQGSHDEARSSLGGLLRLAPEVVEFAEFWEVALRVEKEDGRRAATCLVMAMEHVQREHEKHQLMSVITRYLKESSIPNPPETVDGFFFPTGRRLSFHGASIETSPQREEHSVDFFGSPNISDHQPVEIVAERSRVVTFAERSTMFAAPSQGESKSTANGDVFSLRSLLDELPEVSSTPLVQRVASEVASSRSPIEKRKYKSTPYARLTWKEDFETSFSSVLASPAARVPTPRKGGKGEDDLPLPRPMALLQSRSPARAKMFDQRNDTEEKGMVIVLSPVKESAGSSKRIATPVRRSSRTATVTTEEKNKDALERASYSYAPNAALLTSISSPKPRTLREEDEDPVRRSSRKTKSVEKLSPRFGTKVYN